MGIVALDSSALLCILLHEPDADAMLLAMGKADRLLVSAVTYQETGIVWDNQVAAATDPADLDLLIASLEAEVVSVGNAQAKASREAYKRYGKGNHPAGLNMGDCFSYALAKEYDAPLLFKGNDFSKTDIAIA